MDVSPLEVFKAKLDGALGYALVDDGPPSASGVEARWSLRSLPTQASQ